MWDKHYQSEGFSYRSSVCDKSITIRLSDVELDILKNYFPGKNVSFSIRSIIHLYDSLMREKK